MDGTKADQKRGVIDGSRFVFEEPNQVTSIQANEASNPVISNRPSPDAFMPRPTRPFPISSRDENPKRGNWWNKIEFIFACIAVTNSFTTISNLPYKMYANGGGLFFIVFSLLLLLFLFPYIVLEMSLGQFSSSGFISVWNFSPLFKGLGVVAVIYLVLHNVLVNVLSAYHLIYAFYAVSSAVSSKSLPWTGCSHEWNTQNCYDHSAQMVSPDFVDVHGNVQHNYSNDSMPVVSMDVLPALPAKEFFNSFVGDIFSDLTSIGGLKPNLVFALLATWGFILMLTCLGAKLTGKVAYIILPVTVILPFAMLIRGATLDGAHDGLLYYFTFDMRSILTISFWVDAMSEVFFVGMVGLGVFSSLSSYNKFHNNFCLDAFLIVVAVIIISLLRVLMMATFVGYYAHSLGTSIPDVASSGVETTLVMLPSLLATLPSATAWSCVHFITVFLTIISSSIYVVQALLTTFLDVFHLPHSWIFLLPTSGIICVLSFLISLPMVTEGGLGVLTSIDIFILPWAAPFIAILLPLITVWIYGTNPKWDILRLPREIQRMVGLFPKPLQMIFLLFWACIIPLVSLLFLVCKLIQVDINFARPYWMGFILLAVGIIPLILVPMIVGIFQLVRQRRSYNFFSNLFWKSAQSSADWGPAVEIHRQQIGYSQPYTNPHQINYEIHSNPAAMSPDSMAPQGKTAMAYPRPPPNSPPPPAYNGYPELGSISPNSAKSVSPAPSSVGSPGLPSTYPSPLAGSQLPPASPATVSVTDTVDSNRLYPAASLDYTTGPETDLGLSEHEDSPFINTSSHETTL